MLAPDTCYRALEAKDARFDGLFFVGVSTTGIYCRPICPARTPRRDRCTFHRSGAEAERAGFRACLRCRPELAPGSAPMESIPRLVVRALAGVDEVASGARSIEALAGSLGVSDRHLRRAIEAELGVSPIELVTSRRLAMARQLLSGTALGIAEIAFASGFGSVRRFNAAFRARTGRSPSSLRRATTRGTAAATLSLRLGYRPPLDWDAMLAFLGGRAIAGIERVEDGRYLRSVRAGDHAGVIAVRHDAARCALVAEVPVALAGAAIEIAARLRALFDLDADPSRIAAVLRLDPRLRRSVARRPGLRVPGAWDGLELAVRAVLGQQVSVRAARTLAARLVARLGAPCGDDGGRSFPAAARLAGASEAELAALGILPARARTLIALARAEEDGALRLDRGADVDETLAALVALPGIGEWTAQYVAMRALRWPDALPAGDLVLQQALGTSSGRATAAAVRARAERWSPWRAYGVMHVWAERAGALAS